MLSSDVGRWRIIGLVGMLAISLSTRVSAQTDVSNFRVPDVNDEGVLVSLLTGDKARMYPSKPMWIQNMVIEYYLEDGKTVQMRLTSPECYYNTRTNEASSKEDVFIEGNDFTVEGTGYRFDSNTNRMEILNDVRVVFKNVNLSATPEDEEPATESEPAPQNP